MLESYKHAKNAFVTLTYSQEHLPKGGTLVPKALQDFLKRLRKAVYPTQIRYYACGEYGEQDQRPHYHLAIFGLGPEDAETIDKAWGLGFSFIGDLSHDSAQYIAGYVTKKMTHAEGKCTPQCTHPPLAGRLPEFSRMSLKPGIGAAAAADIRDVLTTPAGCDALARVGDVPHALMMGKKSIPLGKYIRGKVREAMHFPDKKMPQEAFNAYKEEMHKLHKEAFCASEEKALSKYLDKSAKFKEYIIDKNAQRMLQLETKNKIFSAKRNKV